MDIAVIAEGPDAGDRLRSLQEWLSGIEELRGRVDGKERPPEPGTLGPVLDALTVALGPAGAATAFATGLIAWLRTRRGDVHIKVTLPDRSSLELTAKRVSRLDADALQQQVAEVADLLSRQQGDAGGPERRELP
ncbi:effector-associated constant component EACC1 [Streptomyces sp. NPDC001514]